MTSDDDTLIVVTADHAHTMSISGYSRRGDDILGLNGDLSNKDHLPYSTLNYATGPAMMMIEANGSRSHLSPENFGMFEENLVDQNQLSNIKPVEK